MRTLFFLRRRQNFFQKTGKKRRFGLFLKKLTKKLRFFGARSSLKISYIGAAGAFRTFLRLVSQNGCRKVMPKGVPFGKF